MSPTDDSKVAQLLVALKKKLGKPVVKRAPINSEMLLSLVKHFLPEGVESTENLLNFRWACLFSIQYFASARFEEAIHLNIGDIIFTPDSNVLVTFHKAKNNHFGNALQNVISNMDSLFCPFVMIKIYVDLLLEAEQGLDDALFPSLFQSRKVKKGSQVTDDFARNKLKATLVKVGFSEECANKFGLHSFRIGAVQSALASGKLLEVDVQKAGRWKSAATVNTYLVQSEKEMYKFSKPIAGGSF